MRRRCREVGLGAAVAAAAARFPNMKRPGKECTPEGLAMLLYAVLDAAPEGEGPSRPLPTPPTASGAAPSAAGRGRGQAAAARPPNHCHHCGKVAGVGDPSFKVCGGCKAVRFCGDECRLAGWKAGHKAECKRGSAAAAEAGSAVGDGGHGGSRKSGKQQPQAKKAARK
jgi:hypothetical protein